MFVGTPVTFALDLSILPWIAELMWKRKRFTQSTKYDLRSFGDELTTIRNAGGVSREFPGPVPSMRILFRLKARSLPEGVGVVFERGHSHFVSLCSLRIVTTLSIGSASTVCPLPVTVVALSIEL
jgi:hypothetical protein